MLIQKQRRGWESVVIALTVASAMWMTVALYSKRDQVFKERLLIYELMTFRNLATAHLLEHRKMPLTEFSSDPFGNPYHYNPKTGWVSTTTPKYSSW